MGDILELNMPSDHLNSKSVQRLRGTWWKLSPGKENKNTTGRFSGAPFLLSQSHARSKQHYYRYAVPVLPQGECYTQGIGPSLLAKNFPG